MEYIKRSCSQDEFSFLLFKHNITTTITQKYILFSITKNALSFNKKLSLGSCKNNIFLTTTLDELLEVYKLRSKIYAKLQYHREFPDIIDGLNFDVYDEHSAIIYTKKNGRINGTCRLIFDHHKDKLPIDKHYSLDYLRKDGKKLAELSRLVIDHESKGLSQEFKLLTQGTYCTMISNDITNTVSVMSEEHYKWYDKFGGFSIEERFERYGNINKPFIITSWEVAKISIFFKKVFLSYSSFM
ncbi:MAG: hypothetical protein JXQ68_04800 [Campylobacterales bacterium]|nr:hypothetical protein [Campylobacterales bacterium]